MSCESKCSTESPLKAAGHCLLNGETMIKAELMANGPIVAGLVVSADLDPVFESVFRVSGMSSGF